MSAFAGIETIQFKQGTAAAWASVNPTLLLGEPGLESDTGKFKLGNGADAWLDLPYGGAGAVTWADVIAAADFPDFVAAGDTAVDARGEISAVGTWAELQAAPDFPASIGAGDTPEDVRAAIDALGPDDVPTVAGLGSLNDVSVAGGNPGDALIQNSDDTYSIQPVPDPVNFIPAITKDEGDSTPPETAPGTLVFVLAGAGSSWGYDTDAGGGAGTGTVTTAVITLTAPVAAGRYLVIGVAADAAGGVQSAWSAVDSKSNTYTQAVRHIQGNTNQTAILYAKVTTDLAAGDTITVTSDISRAQIAVKAAVIVGVAASSALDKTATGGAASSASLLAGPSATTSQVDEIAFAVFGYQGSGLTFTPTNGWILAGPWKDSAATTARRSCVLVYKVLTATGTVSATGNVTLTATGAPNTVNYSASAATLKKA